MQLLRFNISNLSFNTFISNIVKKATLLQSSYVCVANVHMFIEAYKSKEFAEIVNNADMVTPDGKPLCIALKILYGIEQERVSGMDLFPSLLKEAARQNIKVYFYGSTDEVLNEIETIALKKDPNLIIAGKLSPPFRELNDSETQIIIQDINDSGAGLVFVALGCPKQEKWMASMKGKINACMVGVGGAFPVFAGLQKRAPHWMQKYALEWLFRLFQEPQRLWKRYAVTNSLFVFYILRELVTNKIPLSIESKKRV